MDTLALLCNLYGDGPQTLRRLREAGCGTLAALDTLESERLASLLRTSVRSAKRFQAEGRLLRERSEPSQDRPSARTATEAPAEERADPLVANVLSAWRERDQQAPHAAEEATPAAAATASVRAARPAASAPSLHELVADRDLLERLRRAGIETPEELREADVLDLAGRGVAGYTRLLHLQFLARRASGPTAAGAPDAAAGVLVPARPPERRGDVGRSTAVTPSTAEVPRFSPSPGPPATPPAPLEAELARFATPKAARPAPAPLEDAGSSGPFA